MNNYDLAKTTAELEAQQLGLGESVYLTCPVCHGRSKFSVTRLQHSVVWNCFRDSCPVKGHSVTSAASLPPKRKPQTLRPYRGSFWELSEYQRSYLHARFPIERIPEDIRSSEDRRFVMPIKNPYGWERGYLLRNGWGDYDVGWDGPKAMIYMHAAGPAMSWYPVDGVERLVLVEDQMSAICAQQSGLSACALLGTNLDNDKVREISTWKPKEVIIALDADATESAFKLARKWGLAFAKTRVAILERDLKDEHDLFDIPEVLGL